MTLLDGKIAIVTGAASGFGAQIARRYVEQGACVLLADINAEAASDLAATLGDRANAIRCDVANAADVAAAVRHCVEIFGVPDIVVNNAGLAYKSRPMLEVDEETFDRIFAVNVKSIYYMAQAVIPLMRERRSGVLLNIGSTAGIRPRPGTTWYNASKGAVNLLSKAMAVELAADGIRVNAICPVIGATAMLENFLGAPDTPDNRARFIATIPLGRLSEPDDVAQVAVFLASDGAAFLTGIEIPVDGGRTI
ncbi:glucose 1-dehydrogenase [Paraburkholderia sediminicola]|uniref:glucose 1-dehydrogenase n=1 Tax=Paraburkholderia sediminicola TaxID=458836 RepID=UPI0038B6DFB3